MRTLFERVLYLVQRFSYLATFALLWDDVCWVGLRISPSLQIDQHSDKAP